MRLHNAIMVVVFNGQYSIQVLRPNKELTLSMPRVDLFLYVFEPREDAFL